MAEETKKSTTEWVVVSDVCVAETPTTAIVEKEASPQPEPEVEKVEKLVVEDEKEATAVEDENVVESASFKGKITPPAPPPPVAEECPHAQEADKPKKEDEETAPPPLPPDKVKI
ncbi:Uncharacterized protein Fot_07616 [Forsythia ovata]|uniref:Uncharacterized protein n=1 Tax=Forsythia ovata TaxID=205694 RepID=A0ABD1WWQ0_9LAMI